MLETSGDGIDQQWNRRNPEIPPGNQAAVVACIGNNRATQALTFRVVLQNIVALRAVAYAPTITKNPSLSEPSSEFGDHVESP